MPILATTATATKQVQEDIEKQIHKVDVDRGVDDELQALKAKLKKDE